MNLVKYLKKIWVETDHQWREIYKYTSIINIIQYNT